MEPFESSKKLEEKFLLLETHWKYILHQTKAIKQKLTSTSTEINFSFPLYHNGNRLVCTFRLNIYNLRGHNCVHQNLSPTPE